MDVTNEGNNKTPSPTDSTFNLFRTLNIENITFEQLKGSLSAINEKTIQQPIKWNRKTNSTRQLLSDEQRKKRINELDRWSKKRKAISVIINKTQLLNLNVIEKTLRILPNIDYPSNLNYHHTLMSSENASITAKKWMLNYKKRELEVEKATLERLSKVREMMGQEGIEDIWKNCMASNTKVTDLKDGNDGKIRVIDELILEKMKSAPKQILDLVHMKLTTDLDPFFEKYVLEKVEDCVPEKIPTVSTASPDPLKFSVENLLKPSPPKNETDQQTPGQHLPLRPLQPLLGNFSKNSPIFESVDNLMSALLNLPSNPVSSFNRLLGSSTLGVNVDSKDTAKSFRKRKNQSPVNTSSKKAKFDYNEPNMHQSDSFDGNENKDA